MFSLSRLSTRASCLWLCVHSLHLVCFEHQRSGRANHPRASPSIIFTWFQSRLVLCLLPCCILFPPVHSHLWCSHNQVARRWQHEDDSWLEGDPSLVASWSNFSLILLSTYCIGCVRLLVPAIPVFSIVMWAFEMFCAVSRWDAIRFGIHVAVKSNCSLAGC